MASETRILVGTDAGLFDLTDPSRPVDFDAQLVDHVVDGWAVADGVLHRQDGDGWQAVAPPARFNHLDVTCVAALADGALVGTADAQLWRVRGGQSEEVAGFERAPTRAKWYTPWGGPPDVRSLAVGPGGDWLVNVHVGGILRSADGEQWQDTIDLDTDVHQVLSHGEVVLAALGVSGLAESRDGGATWRETTDGLHAAYCRAVAVAGDTLLLSASSGPGGGDAGVYRRSLHGDEPFERCTDGLPARFDANIDTHCLDAAGEVAVIGARSGDVYRSDDAGGTWTSVAEGLPSIRCLHLGA